jgi:hypothetical protein
VPTDVVRKIDFHLNRVNSVYYSSFFSVVCAAPTPALTRLAGQRAEEVALCTDNDIRNTPYRNSKHFCNASEAQSLLSGTTLSRCPH